MVGASFPLEQQVDAYLAHLRVERALASNTVSAYGRDLSALLEFFQNLAPGEVRRAADVSPPHLHDYLRDLGRQGQSARTMARKLSSLRGFFRYCLDEGMISKDPAGQLDRPRTGRSLPHTSTPEEMLELLAGISTSSLRGLRDRALLSLVYSSGLRVSEVIGLFRGDLDSQGGTVRPTGKGGKTRLVPVSGVTLTHIDDYLAAREQDPRQASSTLLFCGRSGKGLSRQAVWKLVRRYGRSAGVRSDLHPHALRHSFASHLLSGGADLRSVQLLLGHATIQTTEIYTHLARDHVTRAHQKAHPRGQ